MFYIPFILNVLFSIICAYFALFKTRYIVENFIPFPEIIVQLVGVGLILFSGFIIWALMSKHKLIWGTIVTFLDGLWVIITLLLAIILGDYLGVSGVELILIINLVVGTLGILQFFALLLRIQHPDQNSDFDVLLKGNYDIESSIQDFWDCLAKLEDIHKFAPAVKQSIIISGDGGIGTKRQCSDGKSAVWTEEVYDWKEGKSIALRFDPDVEGFPFPFKKMNGGWILSSEQRGKNQVCIWFEMKCKNKVTKLLLPFIGAVWLWSFGRVVKNMDRYA